MRTLSDFIRLLEDNGELVRVRTRVSPVLEIPAIADRLARCPAPHAPSAAAQATDPRFHHLGGPAVLFENVEGSDLPVLINAYGSYRRMELALGRSFQDIADQIAALVKPQPPRSMREAMALLRRFAPLRKIPPKRRRGPAAHHQTILTGDQIDLTKLPLIRCWPLDGDLAAVGWPADINAGIPGVESGPEWDRNFRGRYITLAGVHTIHADDRDDPKPASHNIGMYRVQLLGPRTMAMHWHMHHDGASHWRSWKNLGKPMPVAIALGGEPVLPYAATAPLPPGISELLMAGFLNGRGIELARARTVPLWVPASAEIVIEGFVSDEAGHVGFEPSRHPAPGTGPALGSGAVIEGPFGDHTGFYSLPDRYPILTVTAVTMRERPIYPTTVVGLPPQEDYFLGKATERLFLPLLKTLIHDIEDYDLPMFGAFHNCAFVRIRKQYPLHARRVMHAIWGAGQMSWTKCIFVVDEDVDVHDHAAVLRAAAQRCHPVRDIEITRGPLDILDHAAPYLGAGSKIGFDCTRKFPGAETHGLSAAEAGLDAPIPTATQADLDAIQGTVAPDLARDPSVLEARMHADAPGWLFVRLNRGEGDRYPGGPAHERLPALLPSLGKAVDLHVDLVAHVPRYIICLGRDVDLASPGMCLFHWLANMDPARDSTRMDITDPPRPVPGGPIVFLAFDSTPKGVAPGDQRRDPTRAWPPVLKYDDATRDLIARRWDEYGLSHLNPR